MKRYALILALLLAACAPGPQQSELEPVPPAAEPEAPLPEVAVPEAPEEPAVTVIPAEPEAAPAAPEAEAPAGAGTPAEAEGGAPQSEAAAPTSDPQGTISISADNETFVSSTAGEVNPVTVGAGGTFYLRLNFTDPDGISAAQIELRNSAAEGALPTGPFTVASSDCEAALADTPTDLTCTVAVAVAPEAQNIQQEGEVAYAFRPLVTDAAGNGDLAFSWAYLVVEPQ